MPDYVVQKKPWLRALMWLLVLGPGFFLIYGSVNHFTAIREPVPSIFLGIEANIPVISWHIVPYMLLDLMFVMSLFMCRTVRELDQHARRLACAIITAAVCFLLWPLKFGFERPQLDGWFGVVHHEFTKFDLPFNQAPSLHILLLVMVSIIFIRHSPRWLKYPLLLWSGLIAVSVLTTYQHHIIDIIAAIPIACFCVTLFPDTPERRVDQKVHSRGHWVGSLYYAIAVVCFGIGTLLGYWGSILVLPALACIVMGTAYRFKDERLLQKHGTGKVPWYVRFTLAPVTIAQALYKRWYESKISTIDEVLPNVYIARRLSSREFKACDERLGIKTLIDVAPEFSAPQLPKNVSYCQLNWLDLAPVGQGSLNRAAIILADAIDQGPVMIECKLGLQRSVLVVLAYLVKYQNANVIEAYEEVCGHRQGAVLRKEQLKQLRELQLSYYFS